MRSGSEEDVRHGIQKQLDGVAPGRFLSVERKSAGESAIGKPVDLEIRDARTQRSVVAVEVANVNTTQLVGETCRLYYDSCCLKLLVLGDRNVPKNGAQMCEKLLVRLYGQEKIENTPARVVNWDEDEKLEAALKELLLL